MHGAWGCAALRVHTHTLLLLLLQLLQLLQLLGVDACELGASVHEHGKRGVGAQPHLGGAAVAASGARVNGAGLPACRAREWPRGTKVHSWGQPLLLAGGGRLRVLRCSRRRGNARAVQCTAYTAQHTHTHTPAGNPLHRDIPGAEASATPPPPRDATATREALIFSFLNADQSKLLVRPVPYTHRHLPRRPRRAKAQASFLAEHAAKNYVPLNPRPCARHLAAAGDWRPDRGHVWTKRVCLKIWWHLQDGCQRIVDIEFKIQDRVCFILQRYYVLRWGKSQAFNTGRPPFRSSDSHL